jgi:hypothetical protein
MARRGQITIHVHSAIELMLGAAMIILPFILGFGATAVAFSFTVGALVIGLALTASEPGARGSLPLAAHAAYDWGFGIGLLGAGLAFGLIDGYRPMIFLLAAGAVELLLVAATRYTPSRA